MAKETKSTKKSGVDEFLPSQAIIEEKLTTARIALLMRAPFFGAMATRLKLIRDDDTFDTAATDGRNFYYNLKFIHKLSTKETEFLFGHEVLHNVFEHHFRRGSRFAKLWNVAADYAINDILIQEKIGTKITTVPILHDEKYRGMSSEEIYDLLLEDMDNLDMDSLVSQLLDQHMDHMDDNGKGLSEEEKQQIRNEIKEGLLSAAQSCGNLPAGVDRLVKSFTAPKMNWRDILRQDIQSMIKSDYSFARPNKKALQSGFTIPGMKRDQALSLVCAIDMSGSISDEIAKVLLSEVQGIMEQYNDYEIQIFCFDTEVHNPQTFRSDEGIDLSTYQVKGGGGTLFECCWEFMKTNDIQPTTFLMLTDMYPNAGWGDPDYCPTIFAGYKSNGIVAPFGTTIQIDD